MLGKQIFNTETRTEADEALAFFQRSTTRKGDFQAIRDLVELPNDNDNFDPNVEFDYNTGEYVEVVYMTPENEPLPLQKKSNKFPQLQQFPHLVAFLQNTSISIIFLGVQRAI